MGAFRLSKRRVDVNLGATFHEFGMQVSNLPSEARPFPFPFKGVCFLSVLYLGTYLAPLRMFLGDTAKFTIGFRSLELIGVFTLGTEMVSSKKYTNTSIYIYSIHIYIYI